MGVAQLAGVLTFGENGLGNDESSQQMSDVLGDTVHD